MKLVCYHLNPVEPPCFVLAEGPGGNSLQLQTSGRRKPQLLVFAHSSAALPYLSSLAQWVTVLPTVPWARVLGVSSMAVPMSKYTFPLHSVGASSAPCTREYRVLFFFFIPYSIYPQDDIILKILMSTKFLWWLIPMSVPTRKLWSKFVPACY